MNKTILIKWAFSMSIAVIGFLSFKTNLCLVKLNQELQKEKTRLEFMLNVKNSSENLNFQLQSSCVEDISDIISKY